MSYKERHALMIILRHTVAEEIIYRAGKENESAEEYLRAFRILISRLGEKDNTLIIPGQEEKRYREILSYLLLGGLIEIHPVHEQHRDAGSLISTSRYRSIEKALEGISEMIAEIGTSEGKHKADSQVS